MSTCRLRSKLGRWVSAINERGRVSRIGRETFAERTHLPGAFQAREWRKFVALEAVC